VFWKSLLHNVRLNEIVKDLYFPYNLQGILFPSRFPSPKGNSVVQLLLYACLTLRCIASPPAWNSLLKCYLFQWFQYLVVGLCLRRFLAFKNLGDVQRHLASGPSNSALLSGWHLGNNGTAAVLVGSARSHRFASRVFRVFWHLFSETQLHY